MCLSDMNSNQSYRKKAVSDHVRERADENNDDIEKNQNKKKHKQSK